MKPTTKRFLIIGAVVVLAIVAIILAFSLTGPEEVPYLNSDKTSATLEGMYKSGRVAAFSVEGNYRVKILLNGAEKYDYYAHIASRTAFEQTLARWQEEGAPSVTVLYDDPSSSANLSTFIVPIIVLIVGGLLLLFIMRRSANVNNKAMDFGKTKANKIANSKVRFVDVAGAEEEKQELQEIVDFLKNPRKFTEIGARIPKGVLLVGPPGTGKTLFAKAVAGEANVPFFSISGSDFVEMFVGVGASRVRDLFDQAKKNMPCIVFIDEIDAVGRQRGAGLGGGNDEREQTLNQLLVQMDGFESSDSIIVMAATNRADILDPALMRPGRFDRQVYVNVPDVKGREEIMKVHSRNKPLASDVNFKNVARLTVGFTGADIENMLNEAAILAAREDRKTINMHDISEAINKVIAGPAKRSRVVTETDKRITAYHESGHAIIARKVKFAEKVHEVSIIPRGQAAGYTISLPDNDNNHATKQQLLDEITMLLGGRAAEEIVIKDITTGASSDIKRASTLARKMVTEWGMSDYLGNMYLGASEEVFLGRDYQTQLNYSEEFASKIDGAVRTIIAKQYQEALDILNANRKVMDAMVKLLYEKETIYDTDIDRLFEEAEGKSALSVAEEETEIVTAEDATEVAPTEDKTE
ncbi:MAG: ATP-dependent zinc metalloprotease FtsH [Clostridia bacterium]|nr:ATP-dependent zinc metalloprotease FtsH [Clostridia bacterium]